jgi:hypothetical protein
MPVIEEVIQEDRLKFSFRAGSMASQYDAWSHYRNQFNGAFGGTKAVDIVYADSGTAWLIEVKDYRTHQRTKTSELAEEVALKVRDTMAGILSAALRANDNAEQRVASALLRKRTWRVVLHLEVPASGSRLRPRAIEPDKVLLQLKRLVRAVDPHPAVVDQHSIAPGMNWAVQG